MALASQTLRARGWKTILIPIFDAGNIPPITKAAFEGSFVSNCPKVADACISPDDPNLYADGANASHLWFQDKIHPTQVGQDALAQYVIHAYQQVWGSTQLKRTVYTGGTMFSGWDSFTDIASTSATYTLPSCIGMSGGYNISLRPGSIGNLLKTADSARPSTKRLQQRWSGTPPQHNNGH